jgi:hypothetical protein
MEKKFSIHEFYTTGEAYDACQCWDDVNVGDILIIKGEEVVGIADTWPVAVTVKHGELHTPTDEFKWDSDGGKPYIHVDLAFDIAKAFGWETTTAGR